MSVNKNNFKQQKIFGAMVLAIFASNIPKFQLVFIERVKANSRY